MVDFGIKLESGGAKASNCVQLVLSPQLGTALDHMGCSFYDMFDWMSGPFRPLHQELQQCFASRSCGGVGIVLDMPFPNFQLPGQPVASCGNITVCRHYYPVKPALGELRDKMCENSPIHRCPANLDLQRVCTGMQLLAWN